MAGVVESNGINHSPEMLETRSAERRSGHTAARRCSEKGSQAPNFEGGGTGRHGQAHKYEARRRGANLTAKIWQKPSSVFGLPTMTQIVG